MLMQDFTRFAPVGTAYPALPVTTGMAAGTLVETRTGWTPVERLRAGDAVHTLDGGLRKIAAMDRSWLLPAMQGDILAVPGGAFGNCADLVLLPDQHVLLDLDREDIAQGDLPDALAMLIPASTLDGYRGIQCRRAARPLEAITLLFPEEELVWAASGVLIHCPSIAAGGQSVPQGDVATCLAAPQARRILMARAGEETLPGWCA